MQLIDNEPLDDIYKVGEESRDERVRRNPNHPRGSSPINQSRSPRYTIFYKLPAMYKEHVLVGLLRTSYFRLRGQSSNIRRHLAVKNSFTHRETYYEPMGDGENAGG